MKKERTLKEGARTQEQITSQKKIAAVQLRRQKKEELFHRKRLRYHDQVVIDDLGDIDIDDENGSNNIELEGPAGTTTDSNESVRLWSLLRRIEVRGLPNETKLDLLCQLKDQLLSKRTTKRLLQYENIISLLTNLLSSLHTGIQLETLSCVVNASANVTSGDVLKLKSIYPSLIFFLSSSSAQHQDLSAWALGNIASNSPETRDILLSQGILPPLLNLIKKQKYPNGNVNVIESVAFCLSNLALGQTALPEKALSRSIGNVFYQIRKYIDFDSSDSLISEFCWFLTHLTAQSTFLCECIVDESGIGLLIDLLAYYCQFDVLPIQNIIPLLRSMGNILSGEDEYTTSALSFSKYLPTLQVCLQSRSKLIKLEVLNCLLNMTGGVKKDSQTIMFHESNLIMYVISEILSNESDIALLEKSITIISNLSDHSKKMTKLLVEKTNILKLVLQQLKIGHADVCFHCFQFLDLCFSQVPKSRFSFEELPGDPLTVIQSFETNDNESLRELSTLLYTHYFDSDKEDRDDMYYDQDQDVDYDDYDDGYDDNRGSSDNNDNDNLSTDFNMDNNGLYSF